MMITYALGPQSELEIAGRRLDTDRWQWHTADTATDWPTRTATASDIGAELASGRNLRHVVVGVIGPRDATEAQIATARTVGARLAALGLTMVCGGRSGVMEAAARGCQEAGGTAIGLLPGSTPDEANPFISVPLPTGLGEGRNMVIAKSARALIAVGGSYGTLSEVAYGLHFGKPVITLDGAPQIEGTHPANGPDAAIEALCSALLTPPGAS